MDSSSAGLSSTQAVERQKRLGLNELAEKKKLNFVKIFILQFKSSLIYVLLAASGISLFLKEYTDASVIMLVLIINALIGGFQEYNAAKNAANLNSLIKARVRVIRDGQIIVLEAKYLVCGDIVVLDIGSKVPADIRLIEVTNLRVDEALLTGESLSVEKQLPLVSQSANLADRLNLVFSGSKINSGRGLGIVIATANATQIGKIAKIVVSEAKLTPPLVARMEKFTSQLSIVVLSMCVVFVIIALLRGFDLVEVFFLSIALAVSAIPEGLPIAITVALSVATKRMLKRNVLIRKLHAVEGLGSCSIIASDKTGTLTVNQQTIKVVHLASGAKFYVEGEGYSVAGQIKAEEDGYDYATAPGFQELALAGALANESNLFRKNDQWLYNGDEVDVAFLALAYKSGVVENFRHYMDDVCLTPYQSETKNSAVKCRFHAEELFALKGAVEVVLPLVSHQLAADGSFCSIDRPNIEQQVLHLSAQGYRVLAVAGKKENYPGMVFYGIVGMQDPIRAESKEAIANCKKAGIKVCMVTGDNPATAYAIALELGIAQSASEVITGNELTELDRLGHLALSKVIRQKTIFARVSPLQKMQIVEALHSSGHFIAVTGDGVNDVPALKKANIGIAMGSGSDLTKETADMIVVNDDFSSIIAGVEEGRVAYDNIRKVTYLSISSALGEIFLLIMAVALGFPLPLIAIQILWVNLITNGLQDVALAFEKGEPETMRQVPRPKKESIFNRLMLEQSLISGFTIGIICLGFWIISLRLGVVESHARSLVFLLLILLENIHVFNCRSERRSVFKTPIKNNYFVVGAVISAQLIQVLVAHIPFMQNVLHTDQINLSEWFLLLGLAFILLLIMESYKLLKFR